MTTKQTSELPRVAPKCLTGTPGAVNVKSDLDFALFSTSTPENVSGTAANECYQSIVVKDFAKDGRGEFIDVTLLRRLPEPAKGFWTLQPSVLPDGPPVRLPSTLPPIQGALQLCLSTKDRIGEGRCGTVYTTCLGRLRDLADSSIDIYAPGTPPLPELVIKIADQSRLEDIANEASMYDEMESLQGVAIPYCYGWYDAELAPGCSIPSQNIEDVNPFQVKDRPILLSVLLLERMGDLLPLGGRLPDRSDVWAIFSDLSRFGIDQPDMRYSNILLSPTGNNDLSGKICPHHQRVHKYRAIDFDRARKTDWTVKQHYYQQVGTLGRLLEMMEMNVIWEPWE